MKRKKQKNKTNRRSLNKYPALCPELNLKTRYELISVDYINKLSDKEKNWLNKFNEEEINASLKNPKFNKTKKEQKVCYDRNNARNRDILTRAKASGTINYIEELNDTFEGVKSPEEVLILQELLKEAEEA